MYTPDFFHNIRCLKQKTLSHKQFFLYSILCIFSSVVMNDLSLSSFSPTLFCDIMESISMQREPPQLPFSAHKKQEKKEWPEWREVGGLMEGDDR